MTVNHRSRLGRIQATLIFAGSALMTILLSDFFGASPVATWLTFIAIWGTVIVRGVQWRVTLPCRTEVVSPMRAQSTAPVAPPPPPPNFDAISVEAHRRYRGNIDRINRSELTSEQKDQLLRDELAELERRLRDALE